MRNENKLLKVTDNFSLLVDNLEFKLYKTPSIRSYSRLSKGLFKNVNIDWSKQIHTNYKKVQVIYDFQNIITK